MGPEGGKEGQASEAGFCTGHRFCSSVCIDNLTLFPLADTADSHFLIIVVDTALTEERTKTTYLYYIIYIFQSVGWRVGEVLILAIIVRTVFESSASTLVNALPTINKITVVLLSLLSMAGLGLYTANIVETIIDGSPSFYSGEDVTQSMYYVDFSYGGLYFLVSILVVVYSALLFVKERSQVRSVAEGLRV